MESIINFKNFFFKESEEKKDIEKTISKIPLNHQKLLKNFKITLQPNNTLKGDKSNIGVIHNDKITISAPWRYSREFCLLHEIAHLVYEYKLTKELKKEWENLINKTIKSQKQKSKNKNQSIKALDQNSEELFCMTYAQAYSSNGVIKYDNSEWVNFIKNKVPN